jgi:hypothetical protein
VGLTGRVWTLAQLGPGGQLAETNQDESTHDQWMKMHGPIAQVRVVVDFRCVETIDHKTCTVFRGSKRGWPLPQMDHGPGGQLAVSNQGQRQGWAATPFPLNYDEKPADVPGQASSIPAPSSA